MLRQAEILSPAKHKSLRISETGSYDFASELITVPIVFSEMADVAREYPILFPKSEDLPVALMGAEANVNAYVAADGRWLATYKPARIATYPFSLTPIPNKPNEMALVVDMAAEQVGTEVGLHLFEANGKATSALKVRLDVLRKMKEQEAITARMVRQIREAGLLVERAICVNQADAKERRITGLEFVNEKSLNSMSHESFAKLRDGGVLPLIYAHLMSVSNLRHGVIAGKYIDHSNPTAGVSMVDVERLLMQVDTTPTKNQGKQNATDLSLFADEGDVRLGDVVGLTRDRNKT